MNVKTYAMVSSVIFALVAVLQLAHVVGNWSVVIDGWNVPMWVSMVAIVVSASLSFAGFWASQQIRRLLS